MNQSGLLFAFGILIAGFVLQTFVIWPVESSFRQDDLVDMVSFVFVPHGLKVLVFMMFGVVVFPVVFLAQFINGIMYSGDIATSIISALAGSICVAVPILLLNLSLDKKVMAAPLFDTTTTLNMFWTFMSVACVSSLINGIMHTAIYGFPVDGLTFLYLIGDISGAIVVCLILLMFSKLITARIRGAEVKNDQS